MAPRLVAEGKHYRNVKNHHQNIFWIFDAMDLLSDVNISWNADSIQGWHLCQLEVLECKKIPWPDAATEKKHDIEDCGWTSKEFAYECTINLLTGKTHQVCSSTHILIDMIIIWICWDHPVAMLNGFSDPGPACSLWGTVGWWLYVHASSDCRNGESWYQPVWESKETLHNGGEPKGNRCCRMDW